MRVENIVEYDNGMADVSVHLEQDELQILVEEGLISFLTKYVEQEKELKKVPALLRK
jgi:hypothetical protein